METAVLYYGVSEYDSRGYFKYPKTAKIYIIYLKSKSYEFNFSILIAVVIPGPGNTDYFYIINLV